MSLSLSFSLSLSLSLSPFPHLPTYLPSTSKSFLQGRAKVWAEISICILYDICIASFDHFPVNIFQPSAEVDSKFQNRTIHRVDGVEYTFKNHIRITFFNATFALYNPFKCKTFGIKMFKEMTIGWDSNQRSPV